MVCTPEAPEPVASTEQGQAVTDVRDQGPAVSTSDINYKVGTCQIGLRGLVRPISPAVALILLLTSLHYRTDR